jgi:hypothetical protein
MSVSRSGYYKCSVRNVQEDGIINNYQANFDKMGIRPVLQLEIKEVRSLEKGKGTFKNPYKIISR